MNHTFSASIHIPIQYSINHEAIGNSTTEVRVCQVCGYTISNHPYGWWDETSISPCAGESDEPIPTSGQIIEQYKNNFRKKNAEIIDKFDKYLNDLHQVNYNKKVEWDE